MSEGRRFFKDISASAIQIGVTQVANLLIFYLISKYISKEDFGFYNWSMAVSSTIITVLSLGMDLVYVKRIASGFKEKITISLHFFHTLVTSGVLIVAIGFVTLFFPSLFNFNTLFLLVLVNQSIFTIGNSIKFCLNGLEKYNKLALIAIFTNLLRVSLILTLFFLNYFTIYFIIAAFIASYLIEFIISYFIARKVLNYFVIPKMYFAEYKGLVKESFPQLGTVIISTSSVRIDLILMGLLTTSVKTGEYSFALKIVQLSQIPLLILSPILLTRFSKIFKDGNNITIETPQVLDNFLKIEMVIGILIPLGTVVIWSDFFDSITNNKYGAVNSLTYQIMVIGIPFHYAMNFLWSMAFSQGQLKQILLITIIIFSINFTSNLLFIYWFGGEGAALSDLLTSVVAFALYFKITKQEMYRFKVATPMMALLNGTLSALIALQINLHYSLKLIIAMSIFLTLSYLTKQLSIKSLFSIKNL